MNSFKETGINGIDNWLILKLQSISLTEIFDLDLSFKRAVRSLRENWSYLVDDIEKEALYSDIHNLIIYCRLSIENSDLHELSKRIKYLDDFEKILTSLKFDKSSPSNLIKWTAEKPVLLEIFIQLKNMRTAKGNPLIDNTIREIAVFVKNNFACYQDTKLSTLESELSRLSGNVSKNDRKVEIKLN